MKRLLYSPPESFSLSPLLSILPVKGGVGELEKLTSSFYARYEKVTALKKNLGADEASETTRRVVAEEVMLKQILEWLSVSTESGGAS